MADTTIVFEINLSDCGDRREWSYLELVQDHLTKDGKKRNSTDPFGNSDVTEDQHMKDLAKNLESKYVSLEHVFPSTSPQGTMVTMNRSGKRKRVRIDDFLDPGEGYDTQDSFIDDSEAGTIEGLEDQDATIEAPVGTKPSNVSVLPRATVKKNKSKELLEKAVKRLSTPKQTPSMQRNKLQHLDSLFDAVLANPPAVVNHQQVVPKSPLKPVNEQEPASATTTTDAKVKTEVNDGGSASLTALSECTSVDTKPELAPTPPALPSSLPADVMEAVSSLIKIATPNGTSQRRVMSRPFERELLNMASTLNASNVNQSTRSTVFAHIEGVLQWKRKSLMRRLKKLNEANEDQKMNPLLDSLSDAIARAMPALLESYLRDKETHTQRLKAWQDENSEPTETPVPNADGVPPKRPPKPGAPKKLFRWNNECRHIFHSVITLRLESYHALNIKGPREEYLRSLFPTLIHLWPDGWITNAALWRASLPVFQRFTANHSNSTATPTATTNNTGGKSNNTSNSMSSSNSSISTNTSILNQTPVNKIFKPKWSTTTTPAMVSNPSIVFTPPHSDGLVSSIDGPQPGVIKSRPHNASGRPVTMPSSRAPLTVSTTNTNSNSPVQAIDNRASPSLIASTPVRSMPTSVTEQSGQQTLRHVLGGIRTNMANSIITAASDALSVDSQPGQVLSNCRVVTPDMSKASLISSTGTITPRIMAANNPIFTRPSPCAAPRQTITNSFQTTGTRTTDDNNKSSIATTVASVHTVSTAPVRLPSINTIGLGSSGCKPMAAVSGKVVSAASELIVSTSGLVNSHNRVQSISPVQYHTTVTQRPSLTVQPSTSASIVRLCTSADARALIAQNTVVVPSHMTTGATARSIQLQETPAVTLSTRQVNQLQQRNLQSHSNHVQPNQSNHQQQRSNHHSMLTGNAALLAATSVLLQHSQNARVIASTAPTAVVTARNPPPPPAHQQSLNRRQPQQQLPPGWTHQVVTGLGNFNHCPAPPAAHTSQPPPYMSNANTVVDQQRAHTNARTLSPGPTQVI